MSPPTPDPRERPLTGRTILVVDDATSVRGVLQAALTDAGASVWLAEDGQMAIDLLTDRRPDLILLDLVMPRLNGWGVIEKLKAAPRTAAIPIILETSAEDYGSFDRARRHGVVSFISKPFRLNEVVETCRRVLGGARPLQGTNASGRSTRAIEVCDATGQLLAHGDLIDLDSSGAQVEVSAPLPLGQTVTLVFVDGGTTPTAAEVRWLTNAGERYCQGLLIKKA
jgi:two-component system chemotaxis response regulator CheY